MLAPVSAPPPTSTGSRISASNGGGISALPLPACRHHWLVAATTHTDTYPAHCRRCGATRTFPVIEPPEDALDALLPTDWATLAHAPLGCPTPAAPRPAPDADAEDA